MAGVRLCDSAVVEERRLGEGMWSTVTPRLHLIALFEKMGDVVPPSASLACLNLASEHYLTVEPGVALHLADALVAGAEWARLPELGALGHMRRGDALRRLGRLREAALALDEAGRAFRELPLRDDVGWARTRIGWIMVMHQLGEWGEIEAAIGEAMAVFTARQEVLWAIKLAINSGVIAFERAEYETALAVYDQSLHWITDLDSSRSDVNLLGARIRSNRALALAEIGRFDTALSELESARDVLEQEGHADSALAQQLNVACVRRAMGDYTEALRQLDRVVVAAQQLRGVAREASARHETASILLELGDCRNALWQAQRAHDLYSTLEDENARSGEVLVLCAEILATLGDFDEALDLLDTVETMSVSGESASAPKEASRLQAAVCLARADLYLATADYEAAWPEASRAAATFRDLDRRIDKARAVLVRARALLGLRRPSEAAVEAEDALAYAKPAAVMPLIPPCHHVLAVAALAQGDDALAEEHFASAFDALDDLTCRLAPNLRTFHQASQRIYQDAIDHHLSLARELTALELLERSKSQALVARLTGEAWSEPVAGSSRGVDRGLDAAAAGVRGHETEPADHLARRHHYLYAQLQHLSAAPHSPAIDRKIARLRGEVRGIEARLNDRRIRSELSRALSAEAPRRGAESLASLRAALPEDAVVIEYYFSPARGGVFVLTRDRAIQWCDLDLDGRQMEDLVRLWRDTLDDRMKVDRRADAAPRLDDDLRTASRRLYDALIAPIAHHLAGHRRVVVVPYGATHLLPFGALFDGRCHMIERFGISVAPSAAVLRLCLGRRPGEDGAFVVAGNDWEGRLPGCHSEAIEVAAALGCRAILGRDASVGAILEAAAGPCAVLHLAAHGEARLDNPLFSSVALADGQFMAMEAARMRMEGALVTLSACETGLGAVVGGDEVVGLSWAFLSAGASAVVQSLWRIDDRITARLMARFYDQLRQGNPVSAALRIAQMACLAEPGAGIADWAPYQVSGNGSVTLPGGSHSARDTAPSRSSSARGPVY